MARRPFQLPISAALPSHNGTCSSFANKPALVAVIELVVPRATSCNASALQDLRVTSVFRTAASLLATLALCALVLICGTLAGSPSLHEHVHDDAHHSEHECVISLFAHGSVHFEAAAPLATAAPVSETPLAHTALVSPVSSIEFLRPRERGPPVPPS